MFEELFKQIRKPLYELRDLLETDITDDYIISTIDQIEDELVSLEVYVNETKGPREKVIGISN